MNQICSPTIHDNSKYVGEALSAVDMVVSQGNTLSCLVLGSILSATINTHPSTTFWAYSVRCSPMNYLSEPFAMLTELAQSFGVMAILSLFFIRDEDSYKLPTLSTDEDAPSDDRLI